jgi:hypothetical protein
MVEGARVEMRKLILLMLEQLVFTNPFDPGKVDKYLSDCQPTPCNTSQHLSPHQNLKSCNGRELLVIFCYKVPRVGRYSSIVIATCYGLHGLEIESRWGQDFPHSSRPALGTTQPPVQWYWVFPRG